MMRNFIMRPYRLYRPFTAWLSLLLVSVLLVGCSAARLGYSNGETLSYWWLNSYVDFEADQKPWVKSRIDKIFAWHRRTQLPDYIKLLSQAQKRIHGKVTENELLADYEELKKRVWIMTERALPDLADLALALRPQQIAHIEKKFASNNDDYRKDFLRGDLEERQRVRFKKTLKQAEYWFGNFNNEQEKLLRAASDARPLNNELVMADRLQRQRALIALLKKIQAEHPRREAAIAMLRDYARATMERSANAEHQAFFDASHKANARMIAAIINNATPAQREHFIKNLQHWIDDFDSLSRG